MECPVYHRIAELEAETANLRIKVLEGDLEVSASNVSDNFGTYTEDDAA